MYEIMKHLTVPLALLTLVSCIRESGTGGPELGPGDRLPEFYVTLQDGSALRTSDLSGEVSVIVFFNTGCPDCRKTLPLIQKLYDRYGNGTARFVCISREEGAGPVAEYWSANGYTIPYSAQDDRRIYNLFATFAVPRIYLSDSGGTIRYIYSDNPLPDFNGLESAISTLLYDKSPD